MKIAGALVNSFFPTQIGGHKEIKHLKYVKSSYQNKDYKSAMNGVDKILKVKKDHGETLALKGLMLSRLECKSEAYDCALRGIQNNDKSIFCSIILGFVCQSDYDYERAIEFIQNASKISPFNIDLLRYLSILQAQMRNLPAFVECRCQILKLEPAVCFHHIACAVSHHLNTDCLEAFEILENYEKSRGHISSELLLYKISLLEESGNLEMALEELINKKSIIVSDVAFKEQHVSLLVKLNKFDEAKKIYMELLTQNAENYSYHAGLQKCVASSDSGQYTSNMILELKDLYKSLGENHSSSSALKRMPLDFLQGDEFRKALDIYIRLLLQEGVSTLFSDLCFLYEQPDKVDIIDKVILELGSSIRKTDESIPTPLWTLCLLAQHYDRGGQYMKALSKVNEAIEQNAEVPELYLVKARILKHAGDLETAVSVAEKAKDMDPKNSITEKKYVKRMLQVDKDVVFTKDRSEQKKSLRNMEWMWYELACGDCYYQRGDLGLSLKNYLAVLKYYAKLSEAHFDFRLYRSGKMTLRASVESLRHHELLDPGTYFHKAAIGIIRCYIKLYDSTKSDDKTPICAMGNMFLSEKKMQETTTSRVSHNKKEKLCKNRETSRASKSSDPVGAKLLKVQNPLWEATKYLNLLRRSPPDSFGTNFLLFEVSMRKHDMLEAYRASNDLIRLEKDNPDTLRCLVRFFGRLDSMVLEESVSTALAIPLSTLHNESLIKLIWDFHQRNKDSVIHAVAVAETLLFLQPYKKSTILNFIRVTIFKGTEACHHSVLTSNSAPTMKLGSLSNCIEVHKILKLVFRDAETISRWTEQCKRVFPLSSYFSAMTNDDTSSECGQWLFDSGCYKHCTDNRNLLSGEYDMKGDCVAASGGIVSYSKGGDVLIQSQDCGRSYFLYDVVFLPTGANIISVRNFLWKESCLAQCFCDGFLLRDTRYIDMVSPDYILARGHMLGNKYMFVSKFSGEKEEDSRWYLDSGSCCHTTSNESLLLSCTIKDCEAITITGIDGYLESSTRKGSCELTYSSEDGATRKFVLNDVYVVSRGANILSISAFTSDNECSVLFSPDQYYILDARDDRILKPELTLDYGIVSRGLYFLPTHL